MMKERGKGATLPNSNENEPSPRKEPHMEEYSNPFTPTFGIVPPFMAGRSYIIDDILKALDRGPGDPNLSS